MDDDGHSDWHHARLSLGSQTNGVACAMEQHFPCIAAVANGLVVYVMRGTISELRQDSLLVFLVDRLRSQEDLGLRSRWPWQAAKDSEALAASLR